jgi:hypothetical protein
LENLDVSGSKMDLKGINNSDVDWIHLDLNRNKFWALVTQN